MFRSLARSAAASPFTATSFLSFLFASVLALLRVQLAMPVFEAFPIPVGTRFGPVAAATGCSR